MTPKQLYRAMRQWNISVVFDNEMKEWCAGQCSGEGDTLDSLTVSVLSPLGDLHRASSPMTAVEDYCNARNLEWDV